MNTFFLFCCFLPAVSGFLNQVSPSASGTRWAGPSFVSFVDEVDHAHDQNEDYTKHPAKAKIDTLNSAEDFIDFLVEDERLCMVKFHAAWCKSCQKFGLQYERIGKEIGDLAIQNSDGQQEVIRKGEIRMAQIEYGANRDLCKSLGIKKVPSVHFYSQGKKVDGFPCGPKKIAMLLEKLGQYRKMSPAELSFEADMNEGAAFGQTVLEALCHEQDPLGTGQCMSSFEAKTSD